MTSRETKGHSIRSLARKATRMMLTLSAVVLVCGLVLIGVLFAFSPGKPEPILDENGRPLPGSISEKIHVNINGVEQGMFIKSKDARNPVLLFLHGGPGMPEYFLTQHYPTGLEEDFTVVELDLPVYFLSGIYDYTVNYNLTKDYFEKLQAPLKGFYTFEQSAHSPMFEEPGKMQRILREDVLAGANSLADAK